MTDVTIKLDAHRGMKAQHATDIRRLVADVEANEKALRKRQDELETQLVAVPAKSWREAAEKARYLLNLFASTSAAQDPRRAAIDRQRAGRFRPAVIRRAGVMSEAFDPDDYSVVVKNRARPPKPWRWEIYRAGRQSPVERSQTHFELRGLAHSEGRAALTRLIERLTA